MIAIELEGLTIIPLQLNVIFMNDFSSMYVTLENDYAKRIMDEVDSEGCLIFDFYNLENNLTSDTISYLLDNLATKKVIFINMVNELKDHILEYCDYNFEERNEFEISLIATRNFPEQFIKKVIENIEELKYLKEYLVRESRKTIQPIQDKPYKISSNVYSNLYFDMSKLFYNINVLKTAAYYLAVMIKRKVPEDLKSYKLISSNFNGGIVANILSYLFDIEHISIIKLGPVLKVEDRRFKNEINVSDKFIYIFDFIALGNERKSVKAILEIFNAELEFSIGLCCYKDESDEEDIESVFNISDTGNKMYMCSDYDDLKILEQKK